MIENLLSRNMYWSFLLANVRDISWLPPKKNKKGEQTLNKAFINYIHGAAAANLQASWQEPCNSI